MGSCRFWRSLATDGWRHCCAGRRYRPTTPCTDPSDQVARLADVGQSLVESAAVKIREASSVVGLGEFGIEPDRLAEVGDGALVVTPGAVRVASVDVGEKVLGIDSDRLAEVGDGAGVVAPGA